MVTVGFHASHEQLAPSALLECVRAAESGGFAAAMCSDHFAPWGERQGQSGFAWSWLGAALASTSLPFGVVCAPGQRYHPAIVAQSIATLGEMFPGRFWAALGSGEALNEHVTGDRWPSKAERDARLLECVAVIRALLAGEEVSHDGLVRVDRARLWSRPAESPALVGAAVSEATARVVGGWADGLITVNQPLDVLRRVAAAFRDGGGAGKPVYVQAHLSWAATEDRASALAHDQWRTNVFSSDIAWNLETPAQFDSAAEFVRPEDVLPSVIVSRETGCHAARLQEIVEVTGAAGLFLHHVSPDLSDQRRFIDAFAADVLPQLDAGAGRGVGAELASAEAGGVVRGAETSDLWWKNAVIYCLDVETFLDSDGDGRGDLAGLIERIDYLAGIGVSCLWLMPFYPSPNRDDGYDITDYYAVDHRLGTLGDFVVLIRAAKDRGMRVIIDFVVNHTSDRHPWFRAARSSPNSPFRDYYVWRDEPSDQPGTGVVFPDAEDGIWSYDEKAGQWYLHHFYAHQPDLNIANPKVREEIAKIAGFWTQLGVDGFRVDAVPYLIEFGGIAGAEDGTVTGGTSGPTGGPVELDPHAVLENLRSFLARRRGDALLLGEVNLPAAELCRYFGDGPGNEMNMLFNFPVMQAMYLALARQDAGPLAATLESLPGIPSECQWAMFVRNHDELTLDQLSEEERQEVFAAFGPEEGMQLYGRGLRRRLPPMLDGDAARVRLVYSLLFSLPGTPVLFYGEEIGMGENLEVEGRMSVRTPMQWTEGRNAGFSTAVPSRLARPVTEGRFGPLAVNVAEQRRDPSSLLNWMERVVRRRRETPEIGWGRCTVLDAGHPSVLAHQVSWKGSAVLALHNLSAEPRQVDLAVPPLVDGPGEAAGEGAVSDADELVLVDLLDDGGNPHGLEQGRLQVKLEGYGHRWFAVQSWGSRR